MGTIVDMRSEEVIFFSNVIENVSQMTIFVVHLTLSLLQNLDLFLHDFHRLLDPDAFNLVIS